MPILWKLWKVFTQQSVSSIILLNLIVLGISTIGIRFIEPETFGDIFTALWFVMTTTTTVGYGDISPITISGRAFDMFFIYPVGIGSMGLLIAKVGNIAFEYKKNKEEGKLIFKNSGHYILIGWTKKTQTAIEEISSNEPKAKFVLVDNLSKIPLDSPNVHFISGDPSDEVVLERANIKESKSVTIFADCNLEDPLLADGRTILIASAVEGISKDIYTIVEICKETNIKKFKHIDVDEFILSNESASRLLAKATMHHGSSTIFRQLLSKRYGANWYEIQKKENWNTYEKAANELFQSGATLIAVGEDLEVAKNRKNTIQNNTPLYIVCSEETYQEIK